MEKNINIQQVLFFSFQKKTKPKKQKNVINISYIIIMLIKMRPLMFLVFSQYGLACKYEILFQISVFMFVSSFLYLNET